MIDTKKFVDELVNAGYTALFCVPCSFAGDLISQIIADGRIKYYAASSEGLACAQAAGHVMGGGKPFVIMQSTGIGNSVSVMTSLMIPYSIKFPIISSKRTWKPGDPEVQHAVLAQNLERLIESLDFEYEGIQSEGEDAAKVLIDDMEECFTKHRVLILGQGSFTKSTTPKVDYDHAAMDRIEYLKALNEKFAEREDVIFLGTTGSTSREMYTYMPDVKKFLMAGSMGNLAGVGAGLALALEHRSSGKQKFKVVLLDGDSAYAMHMGGILNLINWCSELAHVDLVHVVFDNGANYTTGGQPSPLGEIPVSDVGCEIYTDYYKYHNNPEGVIDAIEFYSNNGGVTLVDVTCSSSGELPPRPTVEDLVNSKFDLNPFTE